MKGLTFTLAFGKYGGVYATFSSVSWRICVGWMAFTIYFVDLEAFIERIKDHTWNIKT